MKRKILVMLTTLPTLISTVVYLTYDFNRVDVVKPSVIGCWSKKHGAATSRVDFIIICFREDSNFDGAVFSNDIGSDFFGSWKFEQGGKLAFAWGKDDGKKPATDDYFTCGSYSITEKRSLTLSGCADEDLNGNFKWEEN